jgi:hypothetical protein
MMELVQIQVESDYNKLNRYVDALEAEVKQLKLDKIRLEQQLRYYTQLAVNDELKEI